MILLYYLESGEPAMTGSFDRYNDFKKKVLATVAKKAYEGKINENTPNEIARELHPYQRPKYRCCVYKEREITRERSYLAMGRCPDGSKPIPGKFIYVLEAACDDCNIHKVRITDNCRKCLMKACVQACKFGAVYEGESKMHIDYDKCRACTMCAQACPYSSILVSDRPCHRSCPTGALKYYDNEIAYINYEDCINCGQCTASCPFGAISDLSFIVPIINSINAGKKVIALVAPAIIGQFSKASLKQVYSALIKVGFSNVMEVAQAADITTKYEAEEAKLAQKEGRQIATSCCPAFVELTKKKYPEVYKNNTSDVMSPMGIAAMIARQKYPGAVTVFIGPCVAKKAERLLKKNVDNLDYVLTFTELAAMMKAKNILPIDCSEDVEVEQASMSGRNFCNSGGVAKSLNDYLGEIGSDVQLTLHAADGAQECLKCLKDLSRGKLKEDVLEGMMCKGGCIAGVSSQVPNIFVATAHAKKENATTASIKITDAVNEYQKINPIYRKDEN